MNVNFLYLWDKGPVYQLNEDSMCVCECVFKGEKIIYACICDGVGSLENSEILSGVVVSKFKNFMITKGCMLLSEHGINKFKKALYRELEDISIKACNTASDLSFEWGTTICALILYRRRYMVAYLGDSSAYLINSGLKLLTKTNGDEKGRLNNVLGYSGDYRIYMKDGKLLFKDKGLLLCSDGFSRNLSDSFRKSIIKGIKSKEALNEMVTRIRARGEEDNITIIYIGWR